MEGLCEGLCEGLYEGLCRAVQGCAGLCRVVPGCKGPSPGRLAPNADRVSLCERRKDSANARLERPLRILECGERLTERLELRKGAPPQLGGLDDELGRVGDPEGAHQPERHQHRAVWSAKLEDAHVVSALLWRTGEPNAE